MERQVVHYRELVCAFRDLGIERTRPIIAHASLSSIGYVPGGAETVLGAMLEAFETLLMPSFTYKTMLIPEAGPPGNGITYGSGADRNRMATFFHPDMPADRLMGAIPEALRRHPRARRSNHPILSFVGIQGEGFLDSQTLVEPLAPIRLMMEAGGWVLLIGVDHTVNTSIHLAERLAGRKQFLRWALTPDGVVECPGFPGCSDGFNALAPRLEGVKRQVRLGQTWLQALPLRDLITIARKWVEEDALALLCEQPYCERCQAVREQVMREEGIRR